MVDAVACPAAESAIGAASCLARYCASFGISVLERVLGDQKGQAILIPTRPNTEKSMKSLLLSQVQNFVRHTLKRKLRIDLRELKILKEADLECCSYYHIRRFLKKDSTGSIFARKYSPRIGRYPDLVIYHNQKPRLFLELKWRRDEISRKDRKTLRKSRTVLHAKKTYFLCALPDASEYTKLATKMNHEKYRFFECIIDLGFKGSDKNQKIKQWKKSRHEFRM